MDLSLDKPVREELVGEKISVILLALRLGLWM